jgi:hypothetical protein
VLRLIKADFAGSGYVDFGNGAPPGLGDLSANDALCFELFHGGIEIVAHQVEFVARRLAIFGRMNREFRGRHGEDKPAVASVDGAKSQDVAKKGADLVGVRGVHEGVESVDHAAKLSRLGEKD